MQGRCNEHVAKRVQWRPFAWGTAALTAIGMAVGIATAALAAVPPPAPGVAPGTTAVATNNFIFYTAGGGSVWQKVLDSGLPATSVGGRLVSAPSPITATLCRESFSPTRSSPQLNPNAAPTLHPA